MKSLTLSPSQQRHLLSPGDSLCTLLLLNESAVLEESLLPREAVRAVAVGHQTCNDQQTVGIRDALSLQLPIMATIYRREDT